VSSASTAFNREASFASGLAPNDDDEESISVGSADENNPLPTIFKALQFARRLGILLLLGTQPRLKVGHIQSQLANLLPSASVNGKSTRKQT
jgi:hypothetical protein